MKLQGTIHAAFSTLAGRMMDAAALVDDGRQLSYRELAERSDRIARYLQRHGVGRGHRVGLYSHRSIDAVSALLGILKAGAAYVPFDPASPAKLPKII